jgi:hypothetical protein
MIIRSSSKHMREANFSALGRCFLSYLHSWPAAKFTFYAAGALILATLCVVGSHANQNPPARSIDVDKFGLNVDESLVNPLDAKHSDTELKLQISRIIYEARRIGARQLRWQVNTVWPQYECSRDPENQATGELDSAFYKVARQLLEEAQKQGVKVIIVMADLSADTIDHIPTTSAARAEMVAGWARYRAESTGKDAYDGDHVQRCANGFQNGYYSAANPTEVFSNQAVVDRFAARFAKMAAFLSEFPALGALELFNEPPTRVVEQPTFGNAVMQIRAAIRKVAPSTPVYSGVPWWDRKMIDELNACGDLADEPFVEVHSYLDFSKPDTGAQQALDGVVSFLKKIAPGKAFVFAEAGSQTVLPEVAQHTAMVKTLIDLSLSRHVGLWAWGSFIRGDKVAQDYKWDFNPRSLAGVSFRPYFANTAKEASYAREQTVGLRTGDVNRNAKLRIAEIPSSDPDPTKRSRWRLVLDNESFIGFDRLGLFAVKPADSGDFFGVPPGAVLIDEAPDSGRWAQVDLSDKGWRLQIYSCGDGPPTPAYLIASATLATRKDFASCLNSSLVASAAL